MKHDDDQPDLFDPAEAKRRAEAGAKRALDHANRKIDGWGERALEKLVELVLGTPDGGTLMAEDVRVKAYAGGLEPAPDNRAWGAVMKKAEKKGLITWVRFGTTKAKRCHRNPAGVWKVNHG